VACSAFFPAKMKPRRNVLDRKLVEPARHIVDAMALNLNECATPQVDGVIASRQSVRKSPGSAQ
jgi:hypothetical protein